MCYFLSRREEVTWVMNIKLLVDRYAMAMGIDCRAPRRKLTSGILLVGPCERSRSETLPAHLGSVLGSHDPEQMGIMTWSESAHLCRV